MSINKPEPPRTFGAVKKPGTKKTGTIKIKKRPRSLIAFSVITKPLRIQEVRSQQARQLFSCSTIDSFVSTIAAMARRKLIALVPYFEAHKDLPLDQRYHQGEKDSLTHARNAVASLSTIEGREEALSGIERYQTLLGLATLLHDIGKSPHMMKRRGERITYYGHWTEGAKLAKVILRDINENLPPEERLSEAEISLIARLVAIHMEGLNIARELRSREEPEDRQAFMYSKARDFARNIMAGEMIQNPSINTKDVIQLGLLVCEAEIKSGQSAQQTALLENFLKFRKYVEANLDELEKQTDDEFLIPLLGGEDLIDLGVAPSDRAIILRKLSLAQKDNKIKNRQQAVAFVNTEAGLNLSPAELEAIASKAHERRLSLRWEQERIISETPTNGATVIYYETLPLRQFPDQDSFAEIFNAEISTGRYPALEGHMRDHNIRIEEMRKVFFKPNGFFNLLQAERWVRENRRRKITEVKQFGGPVRKSAVARKVKGPNNEELKLTIDLSLGWQSDTEAAGYGIAHINHRRGSQMAAIVGEDSSTTGTAYIQEEYFSKVVEILCKSNAIIPSSRSANGLTFIGKVRDSLYMFIPVFLPEPGRAKIITTTVSAANKSALRKKILVSLIDIFNSVYCTKAQLQEAIVTMNNFLISEGVEDLVSLAEIKVQASTRKSNKAKQVQAKPKKKGSNGPRKARPVPKSITAKDLLAEGFLQGKHMKELLALAKEVEEKKGLRGEALISYLIKIANDHHPDWLAQAS